MAVLLAYPQPSHAASINSFNLAVLPANSAIKDARILLRQALPINNDLIRDIQSSLEKFPRQANLKRWGSMTKDVEKIEQVLDAKQDRILASISPNKQAAATATIAELKQTMQPLKEALAAKERNKIKPLSEKALEYIGLLEADMVPTYPFKVPDAYANLPQLQGRAIVEMTTNKGSFTMTIDGFSAPVNGGQFVDLVQRGFYNGLGFVRADDNYFLQAGDPPGPADGFVDPKTNQVRTVPMEIRLPNKSEFIYGHTLDEVGLTGTLPVLPFSAYGTVAMAHPNNNPNGGSSQFFLYLFESDLTPAGLNLIDGNYTAFGYVTEGEEVLRKLKLGDTIESARVISGAENLVQPKV